MNDTDNTLDSGSSADGALSAAELQQRCAERLEHLGVRPGISRRRLLAVLRKQEGRPIRIKHRGKQGHLVGYPPAVSAMVDRRTDRRHILVLVADPRRSARGRHALLHELSHLLVAPSDDNVVSRIRSASAPTGSALSGSALSGSATDGVPGLQFRCGCNDGEEGEVEMTAHLLAQYTGSVLLAGDIPPGSGPGQVLARRRDTP